MGTFLIVLKKGGARAPSATTWIRACVRVCLLVFDLGYKVILRQCMHNADMKITVQCRQYCKMIVCIMKAKDLACLNRLCFS